MDLTHFGITGSKRAIEYAVMKCLNTMLYQEVERSMNQYEADIITGNNIDIITGNNTDNTVDYDLAEFYTAAMTASHYGCPHLWKYEEEVKELFVDLSDGIVLSNTAEYNALREYNIFCNSITPRTQRIYSIICENDHGLTYKNVDNAEVDRITTQLTPAIIEEFIAEYIFSN